MTNQVKEIIDRYERLRETSLPEKFTQEQIDLINAYPTDESFKVKALRTAGYGKCRECGKDAPIIGNSKFNGFCSKNCEVTSNRKKRFEKIVEECAGYGLTVSGHFESLDDELEFTCSPHGHIFRTSMNQMRYRIKGCKVCSDEAKIVVKPEKILVPKEPKPLKKKKIKNDELIGTFSSKICKGCDQQTLYEVRGDEGSYRAYAPSFCNDECRALAKRKSQITQVEVLKQRMDSDQFEYISEIDDLAQTSKHLIKFKKCGHIYPVILRNIANSPIHYQNGCPSCGAFTSSIAGKIIEFLASINVVYEKNNRQILNGQEIDIFIPEMNLGIEVDGNWWHSSFYKEKDYHLNKTKLARDKGIQLLHLFSDEIENKFDIVSSMIRSRLKMNERLFARKCSVREVQTFEARMFQDNTHLQGYANSTVRIGLYYCDELVSLMTFRKPLMNKHATWEIARFSSKLNLTVVGAANKLMSYFRKHYSGSVMTYSDERYATGEVYSQMGFEYQYTSEPGYFYVVGPNRESRFKYQKHKLKSLGYTQEGTEEEIMKANGIPRIYDCGNKVWLLK